MDRDPLTRVAQNKSLHVVPLSKERESHNGGISVQLNREPVIAICSQATTINSRKLRSHKGNLWPTDLKKVSDKLQVNMGASLNPSARLRPGSVILMEWHNRKNMRPVIVVGVSDFPNAPVHVLAINLAILNAKGEQPFDSALAVAPSRLLEGEFKGMVPVKSLQRAQAVAQQNFGLIPLMC